MDFAGSGPPPDRFESVAAALAARVQAIVQAAEREAAAVQVDLETQRREAESETRRYLADAQLRADALAQQRLERLRGLTDDLVSRAEHARADLDDLLSGLEHAAVELDRTRAGAVEEPAVQARPAPAPDPAPAPAAETPPIRVPEPEPDPEPAPEPSPPPPPPEEPAGGLRRSLRRMPKRRAGSAEPPRSVDAGRLRAIQMAVAGATRADVELHLREGYEIDDVGAVLDDVFGKDSEGSTRMSWGAG